MAGKRRLLVDAGAIVAALDTRDQWHSAALPKFRIMAKPFFTCEAVISEVCFLLGESEFAIDRLWSMITDGVIVLDFSLADHHAAIAQLMKKYRDVPMSLADACLVKMSELVSDSVIFTYDSDFTIYRRNGKQVIPIIGIVDV